MRARNCDLLGKKPNRKARVVTFSHKRIHKVRGYRRRKTHAWNSECRCEARKRTEVRRATRARRAQCVLFRRFSLITRLRCRNPSYRTLRKSRHHVSGGNRTPTRRSCLRPLVRETGPVRSQLLFRNPFTLELYFLLTSWPSAAPCVPSVADYYVLQ